MIESPSLKKILPRHQLTDLSKETLFLGDSGAHKPTQGLLRPNSCIVLIYGIWPIISAIKRIVLGFFCASQIPASQAVQVNVKNAIFISTFGLMLRLLNPRNPLFKGPAKNTGSFGSQRKRV